MTGQEKYTMLINKVLTYSDLCISIRHQIIKL